MKTEAIRTGQHEIGIVTHNGNSFSASGSSVNGRSMIFSCYGFSRVADTYEWEESRK